MPACVKAAPSTPSMGGRPFWSYTLPGGGASTSQNGASTMWSPSAWSQA